MSKKTKFADGVLSLWAKTNGTFPRPLSDLSPLEKWLIERLYTANKGVLPENDWTPLDNKRCKDGCTYSRAMNQSYPRLCVCCSHSERPEITEEDI